jgi:hypothetical protein
MALIMRGCTAVLLVYFAAMHMFLLHLHKESMLKITDLRQACNQDTAKNVKGKMIQNSTSISIVKASKPGKEVNASVRSGTFSKIAWLHPSLRKYCVCNDGKPFSENLSPSIRSVITTDPSHNSSLQSALSALVRKDIRDLGGSAFVLWGLVPPLSTHTHRFIHESIFLAMTNAIIFDAKDDHHSCCCWLDDIVAKEFREEDLVSLIEHSVVFASPHYTPVKLLPYTPKGKYIFHGKSKDPIATDRLALGAKQAVEMIVYRNSMGWPTIPSKIAYAGSPIETWPAGTPVFQEFSCTNRTILLPWGSDALPGTIEQNIPSVTAQELAGRASDPSPFAVFIGSIWRLNLDVWVDFAKGCRAAGLPVHQYGEGGNELQARGVAAHHGPNTRITTRAAETLMRTAFMAPAPQGAGHVESAEKSYITDRVFKLVSLGVPVITNNPGVPLLFRQVDRPAIFFSSNVSTLCADGADYIRGLRNPAGVHRLMRHVAAYHSYLSRMHAMLRFLFAVVGEPASPDRKQARAEDGFGCA